jgi:hypothetical protein
MEQLLKIDLDPTKLTVICAKLKDMCIICGMSFSETKAHRT